MACMIHGMHDSRGHMIHGMYDSWHACMRACMIHAWHAFMARMIHAHGIHDSLHACIHAACMACMASAPRGTTRMRKAKRRGERPFFKVPVKARCVHVILLIDCHPCLCMNMRAHMFDRPRAPPPCQRPTVAGSTSGPQAALRGPCNRASRQGQQLERP